MGQFKKLEDKQMADKQTDNQAGPFSFFQIGQERADAAIALHKELLDAYEKTSRAWLARVQSEAALWTEMATKLAGTRSVSEAVDTYAKCVSEQMKIAAADAQRVVEDCQKVTEKVTKTLGSAWPSSSTAKN